MTITPNPNRLIALAIFVAGCLPLGSWAAGDSAKIRNSVNTAIRPLMAEYDVPGMAVAVTIGGDSMFFNYGVASKKSNKPISEETLFEIGSVSKTFTGTLAAYAQAMGKLSLDDHPSKYVPQLKGSKIDRANLLNLGTYTAGGLPLQFPDEISDDARMIGYFQQWQPDAAPGTRRRYSNPSIGLLGHITGIALASDFSDAMQTQLFPELGLNHSYIRVPESEMVNYAWGYNQENKPIRVNPGMFDAEAYGIKSTAADMIRFVQMNIDPSLLQGPMQHAIEGTHLGFFKVKGMVQGLGWERYSYPIALEQLLAGNSHTMSMESHTATPLTPPQAPSGPTLFNKTGSTNGFGAYVAFVPEKKIGIVILANRNFPIPARIRAVHAILRDLASR
ncbi:MAG TPA: class C beta-lactamase [Candidimonas sp.]|nr:class C beta-lactamase [Candidimonas sp.]